MTNHELEHEMRLMMRLSIRALRLKLFWAGIWVSCLLGGGYGINAAPVKGEVKLITLDPGHFHAALFQREMLKGVSPLVHVYAPLGPDLTAHLNRIAQFNNRRDNPTTWRIEVHASPDFFERLLRERPGNVVVLSGRNSVKIDRILGLVKAGFHVLADKPWIIEPEAFGKLAEALETADRKGVVAFDAMTERFPAWFQVQRWLVNNREIFGTPLAGTTEKPAVTMESTHHLLKQVAGAVSLRPPWFFDIREQGEGLADVGTHFVDLAAWILFPEQPIDWQRDIQVLGGARWPTVLSRDQFLRVTGERDFPDFLKNAVKADRLEYFCNNRVQYRLRGITIKIEVRWEFEAPAGALDTQQLVFRGSRSRVEVRQGGPQNYRPEVYVVPNRQEDFSPLAETLNKQLERLRQIYPGVAVQPQKGHFLIAIPEKCREGHEAHFANVAECFLRYVRRPKLLPAWEKPNMLAKYYVTTKGVELARQTWAENLNR